jgi:hypothetical protein
MLTPSTLAVGAGIALLTTLLTAERRGRPGRKRTDRYETEDGERANPFVDLSEGAESAGDGCRGCGSVLASDSYRFCVSCGTRSTDDD